VIWADVSHSLYLSLLARVISLLLRVITAMARAATPKSNGTIFVPHKAEIKFSISPIAVTYSRSDMAK
jgi:hypothetical protein